MFRISKSYSWTNTHFPGFEDRNYKKRYQLWKARRSQLTEEEHKLRPGTMRWDRQRLKAIKKTIHCCRTKSIRTPARQASSHHHRWFQGTCWRWTQAKCRPPKVFISKPWQRYLDKSMSKEENTLAKMPTASMPQMPQIPWVMNVQQGSSRLGLLFSRM